MFEQKISIFKTFASEPEIISLGQWLKACKRGTNEQKELQVQQYRSAYHRFERKGLSVDDIKNELERTGEDKLKKSLPLATIGAVFTGKKDDKKHPKPGTGYRVEEQISHCTGWIALDIDGKDNPHIKDAATLRDKLSNIVYVAYAGLSVSGKGVWALVKVKHPEKQAEHFEQLIRDFESRNIILDSTKGKNPNDARFYSYDPDAYITKDFKIYDRLPKEKPVSNTGNNYHSFDTCNSDRYGQAAFTDEISILSGTQQGNRNDQLFKSTAALASLVAGGVLNRHEVERALFDAAQSIGLPEYEIKATIKSGFKAGMKNPRTPDNTGMSYHAPARGRTSQGKYGSRNSWPYPENWDSVRIDPESPEYLEATRHALNDANESELKELCRKDPTVRKLMNLFDGEVMAASELELT